MPIFSDAAVVLGRLDYSETSQILVIFTRARGKLRAIARGIKRGTKKRFAVGIDLLEIGMASLSAKEERGEALCTLIEWKQSRGLTGLRERLGRIQSALYVGEITSLLTAEWDPHPPLFDALTATLETLSESDEPAAVVVRYQLILLDAIGSLPLLTECVHCGRAEGLTHFSSFEGGMLCERCADRFHEKKATSAGTLALLQRPSAVRTARPFALLNYHISHLAGREPASSKALMKLARAAETAPD